MADNTIKINIGSLTIKDQAAMSNITIEGVVDSPLVEFVLKLINGEIENSAAQDIRRVTKEAQTFDLLTEMLTQLTSTVKGLTEAVEELDKPKQD